MIQDNWQQLAIIAVVGLVAYALVLWIAALVWTYRDIQERTRDHATQAISVLLVLIFNFPGLLLYIVLRPKSTLAEMYDRQLEAEALLHEIQEQSTCAACRRKVEADFIVCPYCRATLRTACDDCGKPLMSSWVLCPFCGTNRVSPVAARPDAAATVPAPVAPARPKPGSTARYTPPAAPPSIDA
ncbi:MAG TPA: zinc ribbon domain-containing protein [Dehalococcoidia bacterium]|nr:zinc ribbon domain-containing protein [Dehalococcoidia bacterium]